MSDYYVADVGELEETGRKIVRIGSVDVALLLFRGEVLAFENRCLHQGGPVGEGTVINKVVADIDEQGRFYGERFDENEVHLVCPWHGWEYVLPTGECAVSPRMRLRSFDVTVQDSRVMVTVDDELTRSAAPDGAGNR